MPAVLTDSTICDTFVPGTWRGVLEDLRAFSALQARIDEQDDAASPMQIAELVELHERLVAKSASLLEPESLSDLGDDDLARLFARGMLLVMRLKDCIAADQEVLDTAGSRTLSALEADFYQSEENTHAVRRLLQERLALSSGDLAALEAEVEHDLADARRKQAIVRALREEFGLSANSPLLRARVFACFQALYPDAPLVADEVELIATGTLIFFCVPFAGSELVTPRYAGLPVEEQAVVRAFLERNGKFYQRRFANFPAFGFLDGDKVDADLLQRLANRAGLSTTDVAGELGRLVTLLPLAELDKYLVHDVWGHGWQASMLRFERMYEELAEYADPLGLAESAKSHLGRGLTFGGCFDGRGDDLLLDEFRFRQFVQGELAERLPVAMSAVLAEMLADVAEFKFIALQPGRAGDLPSSSLLRIFPAKLDLTLQDLPFYFQQATKVFRLWAKSANRRQQTSAALVAAGASSAAAQAAVARAAAIWDELAEGLFSPSLTWSESPDGRLQVNAFTRVMLNFVGIHRAVIDTYRRLESLSTCGLPLKSYRDLLVLSASVFFEADRPRNLWRVDEFLSVKLIPLCQRLSG
ncbi:MAG: hypothetical protein AB7O62_06560 [Pirellulales bacterium]